MGTRFMNSNFMSTEQLDDSENSPENSSGDSPRSTAMLNYDTKMTTCTSSPKRSRRSIQKRVISVPIKDVEGSRLKGEMGTPPSDSWAWRKYGQKPIKGSPYPRGYYRCSSSKGCPARKQVERSRLDPTMLMVTYSCEHNHPWPAPRNSHNHHHHHGAAAVAVASTNNTTSSRRKINNTIQTEPTISEEEDQEQEQDEQKPTLGNVGSTPAESVDDQKFANLGETTSTLDGDQYWFSDLECTSSTTTILESSSTLLMSTDHVVDDMAMVFTMRDGNDEDESFFADLGVLPECSTVFRRRGMMEREEHHHYRHNNLAPWCGTTTS